MMSVATPEDRNKRTTKFDPPGVNFKGKLIGLEDVADPRGDKMCQVAMAKLKAAVIAIGEHKQRITVNVSLEGVKILDEKTENVLHHHPVHRISFISRDMGDTRAFGYVYNREDGLHQFVGIKTEKVAEPLVACLRDLFQTVVEMKKEKEKELAKNENNIKASTAEIKEEKVEPKIETEPEKKVAPPSTDLLGLDTGVTGLEESVSQMNAFGANSSSNEWFETPFPSAPTGSSPFQTGALSKGQPEAVPVAGPATFLPPQVAGMASNLYQQPMYQQRGIPGLQNPYFGSNPFPVQPSSSGVGMPNAWSPVQPIATVRVPDVDAAARPSNSSWMSFDSSTQISNTFGDLSSPVANANTGINVTFSSVPIQPVSAVANNTAPGNDPFAPTKFPDPFAELAVLTAPGPSQPGKKTSKEDFVKEPPKPSLLDLSQQQQKQQAAVDLTLLSPSSSSTDPFSVRPISTLSNPNPFAEQQTTVNNPFAFDTLDKSSGHANPFALDIVGVAYLGQRSEGAPDQEGQMSRPRPKGHSGTRPGLMLPLSTKNADPFGISSA